MRILSLIFFSVFVCNVHAQSWSLQQCIKYAVEHNILIRQSFVNNEITKNNLAQSRFSVLPEINGNAQHVYNVGKSIDRFTNTFADQTRLSQNFFLSGSVVLWSGLSQHNTIRSNAFNYLSGVERQKQQENNLSLEVANAYIGVIFSEELLKISENQFMVTKEQLHRTVQQVEAGALARSVEYDIRAQLANEELNVTTAQNNYELSLLTLKQVMNLDSTGSFLIVKPDIHVEEGRLLTSDLGNIYEQGLKTQPIIKSSEYAIRSAESFLASSRGRVSPSLSFNANIGTGTSELAVEQNTNTIVGYQPLGVMSNKEILYMPIFATRPIPFNEQFSKNVSKSIGFTLTVPLFNGLSTHTAVKNAKLSAFNAKLNQDLEKQNLYKNIATALANAKAALNKYNASKLSVSAATESFRYAQEKFNAGVISSFDFSNAKNRLFAAESNLLQAKYDYVFKLKVLDFYEGKPLTF